MHGYDNQHSAVVKTLTLPACCMDVMCSFFLVLKNVKMNFNIVCTVHCTELLIYVYNFTCTKIYRHETLVFSYPFLHVLGATLATERTA